MVKSLYNFNFCVNIVKHYSKESSKTMPVERETARRHTIAAIVNLSQSR